jgi:hypothetical protein
MMNMTKDIFEYYGQAVGRTYKLKNTYGKAEVAALDKDSEHKMFYMYTVVIHHGMPNHFTAHEIMPDSFLLMIEGDITDWIK